LLNDPAGINTVQVAAKNVNEHDMEQRVQLVQSNMFAALKPKQVFQLLNLQ
jgi:methylase of polypeptide subunit release factors